MIVRTALRFAVAAPAAGLAMFVRLGGGGHSVPRKPSIHSLHEVPRHPAVVGEIVTDAMTVWLEADARRYHVHPLRKLALHFRKQVGVKAQLEKRPRARFARELCVVRLVGPTAQLAGAW